MRLAGRRRAMGSYGKLLEKRFRKHNRRVWLPGASSHPKIVLVEVNSMRSSHIAYSYLANVLASIRDGGRIVAIRPSARWLGAARMSLSSVLRRLWWLANGAEGRMYKSFGATGIAGPSLWSQVSFALPAIALVRNWYRGGENQRRR